ncbi:MAG: transposase [Deltaproteobacteria bacterium]|nr:transposase [Deltaproteobacteria bacterium]
MARPLRVEYPDAYYHVMSRGNNQQTLYEDDADKEKFLEYLAKASERFSIIIHTYCLMNTHYHLLVQTPEANLSLAMQWLNVSYAMYLNRKRGRCGHLFQGRFKALLIDADGYLTHLSRYIHLNPVRAKMVSLPAEYQWSSYGALIGKRREPEFLEVNRLMSHFGRTLKEARKAYRDFVERVDLKALENPDKQVTAGFVLGDAEFVEWIKTTFLSARGDEKEIPQLKRLKPKVPLEKVVQAVAQEFSCPAELIISKGRKKNKAREVALYIARETSGMSCKELGEYFGGVSGALVTMRHKQVGDESRRNRALKHKIDKIKRRIFNI